MPVRRGVGGKKMSEEAKQKKKVYVETSFVNYLTGLGTTRVGFASWLVIGAPVSGIDFFLRNFQSFTMYSGL